MNNIFSIPKMKIIVISSVILVVLALVFVVISCVNFDRLNSEPDKDETDGAVDVMATPDEEQNEPEPEPEPIIPEDEMGLVYENHGNAATIIGIGTCKKINIEIPEKSPDGLTVTAIATGAFEGCDKIQQIIIPATVKSIGTGAFVGCSSLSSISVNTNNTVYCSVGSVLFSKDKTELICYPSRRVGSSYLLSTNVTDIAPYAFDGVSLLTKILYRGGIRDFQEINIGTGNQIFDKIPMEFNYNAQKP